MMIGIILFNLLVLDILVFTAFWELKKKIRELKKNNIFQMFGSDKK